MNSLPYSPALSSTTSSSASIFSVDGQSLQSSAPSSSRSSALPWENDSQSDNLRNGMIKRDGSVSKLESRLESRPSVLPSSQTHMSDAPVAPQLRQHPRRTNKREAPQASGIPSCRPPPSLIRQSDRKDNFVESLVDTTTQMIEVIWPLSVVPSGRDTVLGGKNLIGLRTFIQEVLKRSKTSYSTLQVALYYLVLIKPHVPKVDFTKVQPDDTHASRAMQCGRRMFLAALILASKYLQDRNYSARAWSKISGLKIAEINSNEIAFVTAIDWRLHVPESRFQRWTEVVMRFSLSPPASTSHDSVWRSVIPHLTSELNEVDLEGAARQALPSHYVDSRVSMSMSPPPTTPQSPMDATPPMLGNVRPAILEPSPQTAREQFTFPPISPRITQLPTPQLTPGPKTPIAPAASCKSVCRRGSSMSAAMRQAQGLSMMRCTLDHYPGSNEVRMPQTSFMSVAPSSTVQTDSSVVSSPESMVSDTSSVFSVVSGTSVSSIGSTGASQFSSIPASPSKRSTHKAGIYNENVGGWPVFGNFSGAAQESFVRGSNASSPSTAEVTPSTYSSGRKRERSMSTICPTSLHIQSEITNMLSATDVTVQTGVEDALPEPSSAVSYLLQSRHSNDSVAQVASGSNDLLESPRKRARCQYEAQRSTKSKDFFHARALLSSQPVV